ncbi:MAG: hypothetical protein JWM99_4194 [Verrucomicrobiales bacterium]|nr:hypothetical protein [Verrucomicrobiales bacterium]
MRVERFLIQDLEFAFQFLCRWTLPAAVLFKAASQVIGHADVDRSAIKAQRVYSDFGHGEIGASEGIRTLDVHLGKVMLYQTELRSLPWKQENANGCRPNCKRSFSEFIRNRKSRRVCRPV